MTSPLTSADLRALAAELTNRFGIQWRPKATALEMQLAGALLAKLQIMDAERFKGFSTTIAIPNPADLAGPPIIVCWLGFDLDEECDEETIFARMMTLVHEAQHAVDMASQGAILFDLWYVIDKDRRCIDEARGYATSAPLRLWRGWAPVPASDVGEKLQSGYGVGAAARVTAEGAYTSLLITVTAGGVYSPVVAFAIGWLDTRAPHLKSQPAA